MSDFNATFAPRADRCPPRDIIENTFTLCDDRRHPHSLERLHKDVRKRARRTNTAGDGCHHDHHCRRRNVLTSGHHCHR